MKKKQMQQTGREEWLCRVFHKWMKKRNGEPGDLRDCYRYAKEEEYYEAKPWSEEQMFRMEMARAISRERIVDDDGNPIRLNHVYRVAAGDGQMLFFWGELLNMKPDKVELSFKQRVHGLGNRAVQIERDKSYYNDKNTHGAQIELDYNLNQFVENAQNPTEYPDERPDNEEMPGE